MNARILALFMLVAGLPVHAGEMIEIMPASRTGDWDWARRGLGIASVTLLGAGATFIALAFSELYSVDENMSGADRVFVNDRIDDYNAAAVTCYSVAAAALAVYLVWKLWPAQDVKVQSGPGGLQLLVRF
jgi:hypothetical protein